MREIKYGDVLFRYLPEYQVWHAGIVVNVKSQHWDYIYILEFGDNDTISLVELQNFLWGRLYFWVGRFEEEKKFYGKSVFRSVKERVQAALDLFETNNLKYTLHKYNCEYFVRRCTFRDQALWPSPQTMLISRSRALLGVKLMSMFLFNITHNLENDLHFEKSMRPTDHKYTVKNGMVVDLEEKK